MNAWAAGLRELRRSLVVVSSDIIVTEPIPTHLERIGWTRGEAITESQQMVDYYRTTSDSRIAFGEGAWGIALGGRIGRTFDRRAKRAMMVKTDFERLYPTLSGVRIEYDWSGPMDRSIVGLPILGHLRDIAKSFMAWAGVEMELAHPCLAGKFWPA